MPTKKRRKNITDTELPAVTSPEEVCPSVYTGQKIADRDPAKYARIVQKLGESKPMSRIAKEEKVSPETISAISKREAKSIDAVQSLTAGLTSYSSQLCLLKIIDKLEDDSLPPGVLPITFGILRDKEKNDLGQATAVIEHKTAITLEQVKGELDKMREEVIEVDSRRAEIESKHDALIDPEES